MSAKPYACVCLGVCVCACDHAFSLFPDEKLTDHKEVVEPFESYTEFRKMLKLKTKQNKKPKQTQDTFVIHFSLSPYTLSLPSY